jgi:hypothetical protein
MVDQAEAAYAALPKIKAADPDLRFIDMVTYATSSTLTIGDALTLGWLELFERKAKTVGR